MKKETKLLVLSSLSSLLVLLLSGYFKGFLQIIIYISAFLLPALGCLYLYYADKSESKMFTLDYLKIGKKEAALALGFVFPTVITVMGASLLTTYFMMLFGKEQTAQISDLPIMAIFRHAILPAFLEELSFRYLPLRLMGNRAPRGTVFLSATLFALVHHSIFSIPYAFVAGIIFMAVDLICDSVIPSFLIHLINNITALLTMGVLGVTVELRVVFIILGVLSLLSLAPLFICGKMLKERGKFAFSKGEGMAFPTEVLLLALPSLSIAVLELWG